MTLTVISLVFAACFGVTVLLLFRALDAIATHRTVIAQLQNQLELQAARLTTVEGDIDQWEGYLQWNRRAVSSLRSDLAPYLPEKTRKGATGATPPVEAKPKPKRRGRRTSFERLLEDDAVILEHPVEPPKDPEEGT